MTTKLTDNIYCWKDNLDWYAQKEYFGYTITVKSDSEFNAVNNLGLFLNVMQTKYNSFHKSTYKKERQKEMQNIMLKYVSQYQIHIMEKIK